jgi:hypothetical protein
MKTPEIIGWIGNIILIFGNWHVGNRKPWAFLAIAVGEFVWISASVLYGSSAMIFICAVFGMLAIRNYLKMSGVE